MVTLLPTPAVNDMGAGKTVEDWDAWTERMKAAHGNGNGHGKSLAIEAQRLLPTPVTQPSTGNGHARNLSKEVSLLPTPNAGDARQRTQTMEQHRAREAAAKASNPKLGGLQLTLATVAQSIGDSTRPPSTDGPQSWDVPLPLQLSPEPKDNPGSHPGSSSS
jgi:DNA (cytosine-5)-methyltransferase 1